VFKSLPVVREIHRAQSLPEAAHDYPRDTITLGWEERLRTRGRRRSDRGVEFGMALPRGTVLRDGDCFVLDRPSLVVAIVEREEPVLVVEPRTPAEWGLYAYYIGNSHQPLMITDWAIVCPDAPGMEQVLVQHGIAYSRCILAFTPVGPVVDHRH
jgi:urease accessory protein